MNIRIKRLRKQIEELENENEKLRATIDTYSEKGYNDNLKNIMALRLRYESAIGDLVNQRESLKRAIKDAQECKEEYESLVLAQQKIAEEYRVYIKKICRKGGANGKVNI